MGLLLLVAVLVAALPWSPREPASVVFSRQQAHSRNHDIYSAHADGREQKRLTAWPGDELTPRFSPDGKRIVFRAARDPGDAPEIWVMAARLHSSGRRASATSGACGRTDPASGT
jgi:Tol biopolymer transport system component